MLWSDVPLAVAALIDTEESPLEMVMWRCLYKFWSIAVSMAVVVLYSSWVTGENYIGHILAASKKPTWTFILNCSILSRATFVPLLIMVGHCSCSRNLVLPSFLFPSTLSPIYCVLPDVFLSLHHFTHLPTVFFFLLFGSVELCTCHFHITFLQHGLLLASSLQNGGQSL